jgi:hypothetical protein
MKAVAGVVAAGLPVAGVEVKDGGFVVIAGQPTPAANLNENPWDEALAEIAGGH